MQAVICMIFEQLIPLSKSIPLAKRAIVPMTAAKASPEPISVAEKFCWLKTKGVRYMTPPAPNEAKKRVLVIKRRSIGNWFHH